MKMYETEISSANILRVAAGTTGKRGGDSGHGCQTVIEIQDEGGTDIEIEILENRFGCKGVRLSLGGDCELDTIIEAFEWLANTLRKHRNDK